MSRSFLLLTLALAIFGVLIGSVVLVEGHVRLLQTGYPIRNAASPKLDGAYSVAGPCGGVSKYGAQGVTTITAGQVMTLKIAYNGQIQQLNIRDRIEHKDWTREVATLF